MYMGKGYHKMWFVPLAVLALDNWFEITRESEERKKLVYFAQLKHIHDFYTYIICISCTIFSFTQKKLKHVHLLCPMCMADHALQAQNVDLTLR